MQEISGVPIDALKKIGFSDADLDYILKGTEEYRERWKAQALKVQGLPESSRQEIIEIATSAFQTGLALGIGKARNIPNAGKKFGFVH